jgi:outer membrane protein assembly factor BamA
MKIRDASLIFSIAAILAAPDPAALAQEAKTSSLPPGWIASTPKGLIAEPDLLRKLANASDGTGNADGEGGDGPYAELGNVITGGGWISAGPGYRHRVLDGLAVVDVSAVVSWNLYKTAQGRFELPHVAHDRLSVGAQVMYQDLLRVNYFGLGNDSFKSDRSGYRLNDTDVLGYAAVRAATWLSVSGRVGWIRQPNLSTMTGRSVSYPNTIDRFTENGAPGIRTPPPSFLHGDISVAADWRDHAGHPTSGGLYRAAAAAYSDRDAGTSSFRRYELEASQFVPLFTKKWILALHGWEVFSDTTSGHLVPFYLLPSLGGQNTLRGYYDYRFHDTNMQVFNAESRWALFSHLDAAVFVDAGKVASRAGDLDFTDLKKSYGAGLRVHNATSTLARIDIGHSMEGWRVFFKISDPFKRSTPASGRSAVIPFVP